MRPPLTAARAVAVARRPVPLTDTRLLLEAAVFDYVTEMFRNYWLRLVVSILMLVAIVTIPRYAHSKESVAEEFGFGLNMDYMTVAALDADSNNMSVYHTFILQMAAMHKQKKKNEVWFGFHDMKAVVFIDTGDWQIKTPEALLPPLVMQNSDKGIWRFNMTGIIKDDPRRVGHLQQHIDQNSSIPITVIVTGSDFQHKHFSAICSTSAYPFTTVSSTCNVSPA